MNDFWGADDASTRRTVLGAMLGGGLALGAPATSALALASDPIVSTKAGKLRGRRVGRGYEFKGVRYGADTTGHRFEPPRPVDRWSGVRDALEYGNQSPQASRAAMPIYRSWYREVPKSEDCLFMNVWTPALGDGGKRPVMVWLHGGGFVTGNGNMPNYDGTRLSQENDVVAVTVTHRLNIFGYLQLGDLLGEKYTDSGNVGMLDIVLALRWVKDNIAAFGGDPNNVMIYGESGGGGKVSTLMAMPAAAGLFHKASVQSGSRGIRAVPRDRGDRYALGLLKVLGLDRSSAARILELPHEQLIAAMEKVDPALGALRPVVGGSLPRHPFDPDAPAISADVPMMIGTTLTEQSVFIGGANPKIFDITWDELPPVLMAEVGRPTLKPEDMTALIAAARKIEPDATPARLLFEITAETGWRYYATTQAERKAALRRAPVYLFVVEYETPVDGGRWGSPHGIDIPLSMATTDISHSFFGPDLTEPKLVERQMTAAWVAFARTGNPSTAKLQWPAYRADTRPTMMFNVQSHVDMDPRRQWRELAAALPGADTVNTRGGPGSGFAVP